MKSCRFCSHTGLHEFIDLGHQPLSNAFLTKEQLDQPEVYYPLKLYVCDSCYLVQVDEYAHAKDIFGASYPYYSSESPSNVSHAKEYVEMMCERFGFGKGSKVLEIGSNDGYLLQWFKEKESRILGFEPAHGPAEAARKKEIRTIEKFFNSKTAKIATTISDDAHADLICGINVLAHQPDINDFVAGLKIALAPNGIITMEFPHLMNLVDKCQFDTIYHEHFSYFSLMTICEIFRRHGLAVFDADEIPEHGGSLRIYARHQEVGKSIVEAESEKMQNLIWSEHNKGLHGINYYLGFHYLIEEIKLDTLGLLQDCYAGGERIVGYGAAAKANTFLNYCGIKKDLLEAVVDRSSHKQGKYLPGSHIPVVSEEYIKNVQPEYILILAWNLKDEIMKQLEYVRGWGGQFVVAIPNLEVL